MVLKIWQCCDCKDINNYSDLGYDKDLECEICPSCGSRNMREVMISKYR